MSTVVGHISNPNIVAKHPSRVMLTRGREGEPSIEGNLIASKIVQISNYEHCLTPVLAFLFGQAFQLTSYTKLDQ